METPATPATNLTLLVAHGKRVTLFLVPCAVVSFATTYAILDLNVIGAILIFLATVLFFIVEFLVIMANSISMIYSETRSES
jgi:hypothetical protein